MLQFYLKMNKIEEILNYSFQNKKILKEALTHSSINNKISYERLEFLGDSIISFFISEYLFTNYKSDNEELLSKKRAQLINKKYISKISKSLNLYKYISINDNIIISDRIHCDIYESLIGALYVDSQDINKIKDFILNTLIDTNMEFQDIIDYKGEIINYYNKSIIETLNINTEKFLNTKKFICSINLKNIYFYGFASNKLDAEQRASFIAVNYINN